MAKLAPLSGPASSAGILLSPTAFSDPGTSHAVPLTTHQQQPDTLPLGAPQTASLPRSRSRSFPSASAQFSAGVAFHNHFTDMETDHLSSQPSSGSSYLSHGPVTWPMGVLPVELYEHVFSFLDREDLKSFRLTCREFDILAIHHYFKNVVVSFRPELYSEIQSGNWPHIMSDGVRIFETFGNNITRFALSLELDEDVLAFPPIKTFQEAIPCFWGLYRWPHNDYHRYRDLSEFEKTADETREMKAALRHLESVTNFGLSCDPGLGYLLGPHRKSYNIPKTPIFRALDDEPRNGVFESMNSSTTLIEAVRPGSNGSWSSHKERLLEQMTVEAGYRSEEVPEAIALLLYSEGSNLFNFSVDSRGLTTEDVYLDSATRHIRGRQLIEPANAMEPRRHPPLLRVDNGNQALIPSKLTTPQKEMLLELEWAHRAMIQSYVLAIIDNSTLGSFRNLRSLTIAKIPSCHVPILTRHDLWESLHGLEEVCLGVVADWRRVSKGPLGDMSDDPVSPTCAVPKVFELLHKHIGRCENIHSLHFEWICGGELARGTFQRNKYILPAPFVESSEIMAMRDAITDFQIPKLRLPYIQRLSIKNCWCSPHVFLDTMSYMALSSLETAHFESVSLSGPPSLHPQGPLYHGAPEAEVQVVQTSTVAQGGGSTSQDVQKRTKLPNQYTWAGLINHFSPVGRPAEQDQDQDQPAKKGVAFKERFNTVFTPYAGSLRRCAERYALNSISFKSCGYVAVDSCYVNNRLILPPGAHGVSNYFTEPANQRSMLHDDSNTLGIISQYIPVAEREVLEGELGMEFGWSDVYHDDLIEEALDDGVEQPGEGRFTGRLGSRREDHYLWDGFVTVNSSNETLAGLGDMSITNDASDEMNTDENASEEPIVVMNIDDAPWYA